MTALAAVRPPTWADYLDAVEAAVHEVQQCLADGRPPLMPELPTPVGPPPPAAESRRAQIAGLLAQVVEQVGRQRDDVSSRLTTLSRQRTRGGYAAVSHGGQLDLVG